MRKFRSDLTAEYVRKLLTYNPDIGEFRWRVDRKGPVRAGNVAGHRGEFYYWILKINCNNYPAHRIAWLIQTGEWPKGEIDHRDMDRSNNRWHNLRDVTHGQNQSNTPLYKNNRLGFKGVSTIPTRPGKYRARIRKDGREISLGVWNTPEEAHAAYVEAMQILHGEYGRV